MSTELLAAMMGAQYKAKENPFGIAAQSIAGNAGNLINPYGSVGSNAAATIGAALLAGLLGGVAKSQTESDNAALTPMVGQLLNASPEERMSIAKQDSRLSPIVAALAAQEMAQKQELAQKKQELQLGSEFRIAEAPKLAAAETDALLARQTALTPGEIAKALQIAEIDRKKQIAVDQAKYAMENGKSGLPSALSGVPKALQDDALKELQAAAKEGKVGDFINSQFEEAKSISSVGALLPTSDAAKKLSGIKISLTTALQAALGREMNAKEQQNLGQAVPDWTDSKSQIEEKQRRFQELMKSITPGRAIVETVQKPKLTPEQARAALRAKGVPGY